MNTLSTYDPEIAPNAESWLALDEQERIDLVERYHSSAKIKLPSVKAHAAFHAIIENQIALGVASVVRAVPRLMKQGLTRHDAIHAIASVLAEHFYKLGNAKKNEARVTPQEYDAAVDRLNASDWLASHAEHPA